MAQRIRRAAFAWGLSVAAGAALAAPGDVFLGPLPDAAAGRFELRLEADRADRALDPFQDRVVDPSAPQRAPGSVDGLQLGVRWQARDGLWLHALLGEREVDDGLDRYRFDRWLLALQGRLSDAAAGRPGWSWRLAAWGHRSDVMESRTPVTIDGAVLESVRVDSPSDRSLQADLVAHWPLRRGLDAYASAGAGVTRLDYADLSATTTLDGCRYELDFQGNDIFGSLAGPCSAAGGIIEQFFDSSQSFGVDVPRELGWRGRYAQLGVGLRWQRGAWSLHGGYLVHRVWRRDVDDIASSRGDPVQRINHHVALEAGWRVAPAVTVYLRGQRSSRLFFDELPVTYNSSTSGSFGRHFSLFTLGLRAGF